MPPDSLTKEIRLTQDLMELFSTHQIPSDLLAFSGDEAESQSARLDAVRGHVARVQDMLLRAKEKEVADAQMQRDYEGKKQLIDQ